MDAGTIGKFEIYGSEREQNQDLHHESKICRFKENDVEDKTTVNYENNSNQIHGGTCAEVSTKSQF